MNSEFMTGGRGASTFTVSGGDLGGASASGAGPASLRMHRYNPFVRGDCDVSEPFTIELDPECHIAAHAVSRNFDDGRRSSHEFIVSGVQLEPGGSCRLALEDRRFAWGRVEEGHMLIHPSSSTLTLVLALDTVGEQFVTGAKLQLSMSVAWVPLR